MSELFDCRFKGSGIKRLIHGCTSTTQMETWSKLAHRQEISMTFRKSYDPFMYVWVRLCVHVDLFKCLLTLFCDFSDNIRLIISHWDKVTVFVSITWKTRFNVPDTPVLQNLTKINNDDGSVTLKWNLINKVMIESIKYIVRYGDEKIILLASQKEFRIPAGYERVKLSVKVSKNV